MKIFTFKYLLCLAVLTLGSTYQTWAQNETPQNQRLTKEQQSLIPIAAYTAKGELQHLKSALNKGLDAGLTVNETKEAIVHLYAYCGFPRSIRGLQTLMAVLDERKAKGIHDEWGPEASPIRDERSRYERGKAVLGDLTGTPQDGPKTGYAAFSPEIEVFLKEHLFADIFERDVLSYPERELVTISALSSMGGVEPMLRGHFNICLNVGYSPGQLRQFAGIIASTVGKNEGKAAQAVLDEVLKSR
ncbi:carboxymuconolactone decarboxylase family protein [Pontibacter sp. E15-1]|uniref:carboxymuconolactone decarboxylase family protein n=1 Tax=Pontibacter sp. E15-1 TaxID=2919918 RepID=UPI001F4F7FFF|nr:carboxymuconolactone decarboxylase family protein [Pontibacter sp. E15-1]MCJ8165114.1 carboxymuconolactone decarboxylase family protein [Pontibacter sp. E15-1]